MDGPSGVRKGAWTREEDVLLTNCIQKHGAGRWHQVPQRSGLNRCRKSCRLRWLNYLRPDIKRGEFAADEVDLIIRLHKLLGNRWSLIAGRLPGRTSNDVKNYWNTHLSKNYSPRRKAEQEKSAVKVTVIKPRPWTFTNNNNLNLSSLRKDQDQDVQPADHHTTTLISKPPPPPFSEEELSWLNSLLLSDETEKEQHEESSSTYMVGDGSAGKHLSSSIPSSLEEVDIPPVAVGGETSMFNIDEKDNESGSWSHQYLSAFHNDLWNL